MAPAGLAALAAFGFFDAAFGFGGMTICAAQTGRASRLVGVGAAPTCMRGRGGRTGKGRPNGPAGAVESGYAWRAITLSGAKVRKVA